MKYRIHLPDYFMQYAKDNIEKICVPIGVNKTGHTKLFNVKMLKYCGKIIDLKLNLDQEGNTCLLVQDNDNSRMWHFYEGWYEELIPVRLHVRRGGRKSKGFQLCYIE